MMSKTLHGCSSKKKLFTLLKIDVDQTISIFKSCITYETYTKNNREINKPSDQLKYIQKNLLKLLTSDSNLFTNTDWIHSLTKNKSYITNAKSHINNSFFLKLDIFHFFQSCLRNDVYIFFKNEYNLPPDISELLTEITTCNNHLATGSPVSPLLSYLIYKEHFQKLYEYCNNLGLTISLYVDDLTISSTKDFNSSVIIRNISTILKDAGLILNYNKSQKIILSKSQAVNITGVIINGKHQLKVPNHQRLNLINSAKDYHTHSTKYKLKKLTGHISYAKSIEPDSFKNIIPKNNKTIKN